MPKTQSGLLAIEPGIRQTAKRAETDAYHILQRTALLSGYSKTYTPKDDNADPWDRRPDEGVKVQIEAEAVLREVSADLAKWFNTMAIKESTNAVATADVTVDGQVLLANVPTTYLLFLERQLVDLLTFVSKLPILDAAENWGHTEGVTAWASTPVITVSTKKIPRNHVLAEATDKHPAQVQVYHEDEIIGRWTAVKFSGAVPAKRVAELVERVKKLQVAVKDARDTANRTELVTELEDAGNKVIAYVLG